METSPLKFRAAELVTVDLGSSEVEGAALAKIFFGISKEWELSQDEQSVFLGRSSNTIRGWKDNMRIPIPQSADMNHIQLLLFINFWQSLASFISSKQEQIRWIKEPNAGFGMKSPLQLIRENPANLRRIVEFVDRLRNP